MTGFEAKTTPDLLRTAERLEASMQRTVDKQIADPTFGHEHPWHTVTFQIQLPILEQIVMVLHDRGVHFESRIVT